MYGRKRCVENMECTEENDMFMEDRECNNIQNSNREGLIPDHWRIPMNTILTGNEDYMRTYLIMRHIKRGDLAGFLHFLLSPAFQTREGKLAVISILELLPSHRQNFIRDFYNEHKWDFPQPLLKRLIPNIAEDFLGKRKSISQNNTQSQRVKRRCIDPQVFSPSLSQRGLLLTKAPLTQTQESFLIQCANQEAYLSQSEQAQILKSVQLVTNGDTNLDGLENNRIWNKLFENTNTLISLAKMFPVQEEKVCLNVAQHYGTNHVLANTAFVFIIPSLLNESKHFSRTILKAVEIFANSFPMLVVDNYLLPAIRSHEAKDVGKNYKSILKLLPPPSQQMFFEKLLSQLSHEEWSSEAINIVASCLELKPKLSHFHISSILNSLLSFTNVQISQTKSLGEILVHFVKFYTNICKSKQEELLRIIPNIGKLQQRIIEKKLR